MLVDKPNMNAMLSTALRRMVLAPTADFDFIGSNIAGMFTNVLQARSMEYTLDAGIDLWLTKHRFPQLQRDYLDAEKTKVFFERSQDLLKRMGRKGVVAQMHCRHVAPAHGRHIWGNCMLGFTLRTGRPGLPPTLGLHSRSGYLGYLAPLDCALAYAVAREIGQRAGIAPEEFGFVWYLDCMNWHPLKSIPWMMANGLLPQLNSKKAHRLYPSKDYPLVEMQRKAWAQMDRNYQARVGTDFDTEKWSQVIRINKRFQRTMDGDLMPSIPLSELRLLERYL